MVSDSPSHSVITLKGSRLDVVVTVTVSGQHRKLCYIKFITETISNNVLAEPPGFLAEN